MIPLNYKSKLNLLETEIAIKELKDYFEKLLSEKLNLTRVSAPLFVLSETGLNDNLDGTQVPVNFNVFDNKKAEIVHSLAKWKRFALHRYGIKPNFGLYTDMNAIRKDETLDNIHSYYVDQWDWERIIAKEERTLEKLYEIVNSIYDVFKSTLYFIKCKYPTLSCDLPDKITFINSEDLEKMYPELSSKEREYEITKKHGAVFIIGIGKVLSSGKKHDERSPDYDDWELNGDILFWFPTLDIAMEMSSMGIRVDSKSLMKQLKATDTLDRLEKDYHKMILNDELPFTVGGGIGESRLCMFYLEKAHIGEVQSSLWPSDIINEYKQNNIYFL